jgi:hypothetical protein
VKGLEISMKKERNKCKHKIYRLKGSIYSLYLLLFNFTSRPPSQSFFTLFFSYAVVISVELLMVGFYALHLVYPVTTSSHSEIMQLYGIAIVHLAFYPLVPVISAILAIVSVS